MKHHQSHKSFLLWMINLTANWQVNQGNCILDTLFIEVNFFSGKYLKKHIS